MYIDSSEIINDDNEIIGVLNKLKILEKTINNMIGKIGMMA